MALGTERRAPMKAPNVQLKTLREWTKGLFTSRDADRTPENGLLITENVWLDQDGTATPRPGLTLYGVQPVGTVIGQIYEFVYINTAVTPNVPQTWNIWMENRGGVGTVIISKDGGAHTVVTGKTYSVTNVKPHFEQIYGYVVITNGVDTLSYMNIQSQTITPFASLTTPSAVVATAAAALTSGAPYINLRYRATAANQGETAGSTASVVTVNKLREQWNGTTEYVTITGTIPTGTSRVVIYEGTEPGLEEFLDIVNVSSGAVTFTYTDTGSIATNSFRLCPAGDSTAGPKTTRSTNVKGQLYMVGDNDNQGRIWFGGTGASALDLSSYNGGGWVEPNKGGKDFPVAVRAFRDGKGTPMAACFSKGTNGGGKRYLLQPATTTLGTTTITYMAVQEDNGQDGTDSPDGVVMVNDAAYYPSRNGFKTSTTKAQIQNIISTQGISGNIAPDVEALSSQYMESCVGVAKDQVIYWAVPAGSTTNSQLWVLDLRQKGAAWVRPWYIAADWLWLYADNTDGKTKMLALVGNKFYEFDTNRATNDNDVAFQTNIGTGEIKFGDNGEWGAVIDVTFEFLRAQGNINLSVNVNTEDGLIPFTDTMPSSSTDTVSAHSRFGWGMSGWGGLMTSLLSVSSVKRRRKWTIPIDEESDSFSCNISSIDSGVSYQLHKIIVRYVPIGFKEIDN